MYNEKDFEILKTLVLQDVPGTEEIILFGSYARGTAEERSDLDIAIITGQVFERKEKLRILTELRWDTAQRGYNVDYILKPRREYLQESEQPTLFRTIAREGNRLWRKD